MGLEDELKNVLGGSGGSGPVSGALQGALGGAMFGNPVGGALGGMLGGSGHPLLGMLLPMLLSGGLGNMLHRFHSKGLRHKTSAWVATEANTPASSLSSADVMNALGVDEVADLAKQSGLTPDEVAEQLSKILPTVVDQVTPGGKLPSEDELLTLLHSVRVDAAPATPNT